MEPKTIQSSEVDIRNCENEPIHIIGKIQGHGALIACGLNDLQIKQVSANSKELLGFSPDQLIGQHIEMIFEENQLPQLFSTTRNPDFFDTEKIKINGKDFLILPHVTDSLMVLDFEPLRQSTDPYLLQKKLSEVMSRLKSADTVEELCSISAGLVKQMFGYDRVMLYRFDENWNGEVVAEKKNPEATSWLGLHYPASDIPKQARQMFFKQQVRIIADANYIPVPLVSGSSQKREQPLNLSKSHLRGVSPIHIEYLKNMGVGASLTAAIIVENELWGLVACHHDTSKFLNFFERQNAKFLVQVLSNEISLRETNSHLLHSEMAAGLREKIQQQIQKQDDLFSALCGPREKFTDLVSCSGGALVLEGNISVIGKTPSVVEVEELVEGFLKLKKSDVFYTKQLCSDFPKAKNYIDKASGLLSTRLTKDDYILWFRPEVRQMVNWGGNPENKVSYNEKEKRLSPRKSFEKWSQELKGTSINWKKSDISVVKSFRNDLRSVILEKQVKKIYSLNQELKKASADLELFSYGLGHDLQAPIRGIEGYVQILKEDHSQELNHDGKEKLEEVSKMIKKTQVLISDLLSYHKFTSGHLQKSLFSFKDLITEILDLYNLPINFPKTKIKVEENLPELFGDRRMLFQAWYNLIGNALKYSSKAKNPEIIIGHESSDNETICFIRDNGIGVSENNRKKIFKPFTRVAGGHFEGSGIGLALVKKVVEAHFGEIWVESSEELFSKFYVKLPKDKR